MWSLRIIFLGNNYPALDERLRSMKCFYVRTRLRFSAIGPSLLHQVLTQNQMSERLYPSWRQHIWWNKADQNSMETEEQNNTHNWVTRGLLEDRVEEQTHTSASSSFHRAFEIFWEKEKKTYLTTRENGGKWLIYSWVEERRERAVGSGVLSRRVDYIHRPNLDEFELSLKKLNRWTDYLSWRIWR